MSAGAPPERRRHVRRTPWQRTRDAAGILRRTVGSFLEHQMPDRAAALTYYAVLSLFPALFIGVAVLGLAGRPDTATRFAAYLDDRGVAPSVVNPIRDFIEAAIAQSTGRLSLALVVAVLLAIYFASGLYGAAGRALNEVFAVEEGRPWVQRKPQDIGATLLLILLYAMAAALLFLGGDLARDAFAALGIGGDAVGVWNTVRWPAALVVVILAYDLIYEFAPNMRLRLRLASAGALLAVMLTLAASAGFFAYVDNLGRYGATYGAFAGAVILFIWLYLVQVSMLLGAELNAELRRAPVVPRQAKTWGGDAGEAGFPPGPRPVTDRAKSAPEDGSTGPPAPDS